MTSKTLTTEPSTTTDRLSTGIEGVDEVLNGGLIPRRSTLVRGPPGVGKTLFGVHFLTEGTANDETSLFINLGEPEEYLRQDIASFGLDFDPVDFLDLGPSSDEFNAEATYDVFEPAEVEGQSLASEITDRIDEVGPDRVVIDPSTQLRYIAPNAHQFRKQMLALLQLLREQGATTVFTSQRSDATPDDDLQFLSDTVVHLDHSESHELEVTKFRGSDFHRGTHSIRITEEGFECAPKLVPEHHTKEFTAETISSGIPELDELLHGGIERGRVTYLSGPTGVGKTTTGLQFMKEAAGRGENSVLYSFEEGTNTLLHRAEAVNIPVAAMIDRGTLQIEEIQPMDLTAAEFGQRVRYAVEEDGAEIVMIDAVGGYRHSIQDVSEDIVDEIAVVCRYLKNMGVTTILVNEVHDITGEFRVTESSISYLADNIVFLRHIEHRGELQKVIGVLKKRTSDYEKRLRELRITEHGIKVGDPMSELRGILTGTPERDIGGERVERGE